MVRKRIVQVRFVAKAGREWECGSVCRAGAKGRGSARHVAAAGDGAGQTGLVALNGTGAQWPWRGMSQRPVRLGGIRSVALARVSSK